MHTDDLHLPQEFDMPASRLRHRREHLAAELRHAASPAPRRVRRRRLALALAGAACAAVAASPAIDLIDAGGAHGSVVDQAVAAVSSEDAIYHVVALRTVRHQTDDPRVLEAFDFEDVDMFEDVTQYSEAWMGPGNRNRMLLYEADGRNRGQLLVEMASNGTVGRQFDPRTNKVMVIRGVASKRPRGPAPAPRATVPRALQETEDPSVQLRRLHEEGRLRLDGTETVRGRHAYRLVSETWVDPNEEGHTERVVFLVDADTYLPFVQRNVSTQLGIRGLPEALRPSAEMYETPVTTTATREFLTYEKLPANPENMAQLELGRHPGATIFDPFEPGTKGGSRSARP